MILLLIYCTCTIVLYSFVVYGMMKDKYLHLVSKYRVNIIGAIFTAPLTFPIVLLLTFLVIIAKLSKKL